MNPKSATRARGRRRPSSASPCNRRWQDRTTQEWQESTSFFDVVCWRDLAENVALSLTKGMRVVVTGRLEHRTWETEEGEHRSKVEITADEVGASLRFATVTSTRWSGGDRLPRRTATPTRSRRWRSRPERCPGSSPRLPGRRRRHTSPERLPSHRRSAPAVGRGRRGLRVVSLLPWRLCCGRGPDHAVGGASRPVDRASAAAVVSPSGRPRRPRARRSGRAS